jgi:hypothetical protein
MENVMKIGGNEEEWRKEYVDGMEEMKNGKVIKDEVCGYEEDGMKVVYIFEMNSYKVVIVNKEMV